MDQDRRNPQLNRVAGGLKPNCFCHCFILRSIHAHATNAYKPIQIIQTQTKSKAMRTRKREDTHAKTDIRMHGHKNTCTQTSKQNILPVNICEHTFSIERSAPPKTARKRICLHLFAMYSSFSSKVLSISHWSSVLLKSAFLSLCETSFVCSCSFLVDVCSSMKYVANIMEEVFSIHSNFVFSHLPKTLLSDSLVIHEGVVALF